MDSSIKDPSWEQLMLLRDLTKRTGVLHEIQVTNLKIWPLVAFTHAKTSEFNWDVDSHKINFFLTTEGAPPKSMKARFDWLDQSVKTLLGPEWGITINMNGKEKFSSTGKKILNE